MASNSEQECVKNAEAYFQRHRIRPLLTTLLVELAKAQPQDPITFMQQLLVAQEATQDADKRTVTSSSETVQFVVKGRLFTVAVPNLRLSVHPEATLSKAALGACDGDGPIQIDGDPELFPYILDMHRLQSHYGSEKCIIPATMSKQSLLQEARKFGLKASLESIVYEEDCCSSVQTGSKLSEEAALQYRSWTADQVADWLITVQHGRFLNFAERFRREGVDGGVLASMSTDKLKALGMMDPKTQRAFLAAIEAHGQEFAVLAVDQSEELARVAARKQREASPDVHDEEGPNPIDAAAMMLRAMFGETGSAESFLRLIEEWRVEHPPANYDAGEGNGRAPGSDAKPSNGIIVAARVRPLLADGPDAGALEVGDFESVTVPAADNAGIVVHVCGMQRDGSTPNVEHKSFNVHKAVAPTGEESFVFKIAEPVVRAAIDHCMRTTILCYGQTGSGKTHTVGHLAQRTVAFLYEILGAGAVVVMEAFELKGGAKKMGTSLALSLHDDTKPQLSLFEGTDGAMHVGGSDGVLCEPGQPITSAHCVQASSSEELYSLFKQAAQRRAARETGRNAASSRTHAFYRFYLAESSPENADGVVSATGACIELVDLAGSESNKDALYHNKTQIDERAKINSSLQALNTCIQKHVQKSSFVPFRSDKLTQLLKPCFNKRDAALDGVPTVLFMACLSPLASDSQQSMRTLTYTQQLTGAGAKPAKSAKQTGFLAEGRKRLAEAVKMGDAAVIRQAITWAHNNGVTGPERRRAEEALQALEPEEADA
eukprot:TRINITY_DN8537_c0_g1_i1.p1 TRINITY_DN8537_c0_g1~~TRINITY_DN8537_c0_g1_i1.p1  ORF type:complete len:792 (+),score=150.28 TRINITY_DN8537_c0_g1_i1:60-2378(+)